MAQLCQLPGRQECLCQRFHEIIINRFARLRQQQQENVDFINEQWQSFLCSLIPGEEGAAAHESPKPAESEISQQEIEAKVNAIARELMEIIGK